MTNEYDYHNCRKHAYNSINDNEKYFWMQNVKWKWLMTFVKTGDNAMFENDYVQDDC